MLANININEGFDFLNNNKLVVFDLDGTLNKTELYAVPAHKKALAELNIFDKTDELIISTFGARGEDEVHLLINDTDYEKGQTYMHRVGEYEREFIKDYAGSFEGVSQMLKKLKADGYQTAVCSNASERYITMVLERLDIISDIDFIQPLIKDMIKDDTLRLLLSRVKPEKAVMVGDRVYDKLAARANNLPFIGCLYGFRADEVCDGDAAVETAGEINAAVEKLIG